MLRVCGQIITKQGVPFISCSLRHNVNYFQTAIKSPQTCMAKRSASTSLTGPGAPTMKNEEEVTPLGWFLMVRNQFLQHNCEVRLLVIINS